MTEIAEGVHHAAVVVAHGIKLAGYKVTNEAFFDTLKIDVGYDKEFILSKACSMGINLRNYPGENCVGVALDDTVTSEDIDTILASFGCPIAVDDFNEVDMDECEKLTIQNHEHFTRKSEFMTHPNFKKIRSELELVRYIKVSFLSIDRICRFIDFLETSNFLIRRIFRCTEFLFIDF